MMLDYIDRIVIVDDSKEESYALETMLRDQDIDVCSYTPDEARKVQLKKNRQLLFFDLSMDDGMSITENISTILRPILLHMLPQNFGAYGLILWTRHIEDISQVKEKIQNDKGKYPLPLFIMGMDKSVYISKGNYGTLFDDIIEHLHSNKAVYFFFNWRNTVYSGVDKTVSDIYNMEPEYDKQETNLTYLLYKMAQNYTGIPDKELPSYNLTLDAYKSFDELLYSDLISLIREDISLFDDFVENPWKEDIKHSIDIYAKLNSKLFIDNMNLVQNVIMPGNVYKIKCDFHKMAGSPRKGDNIIVELTPPCDFSHKKVSSRVVLGFMLECPESEEKLNKYNKIFKADNRYIIWPIEIGEGIKYICFDFRYVYGIEDTALKDSSNFELIFKVKHRLFSDILQKFSSHAARLGLSIIQPEF